MAKSLTLPEPLRYTGSVRESLNSRVTHQAKKEADGGPSENPPPALS